MSVARASLVMRPPAMRPAVRTTAAMRPSAATSLRVRVGRVGLPVTRNVRRVAPGRARTVMVQAMADEKDQGALVADSEVAISKVPVRARPAFVAAYPTPGRACLPLAHTLVAVCSRHRTHNVVKTSSSTPRIIAARTDLAPRQLAIEHVYPHGNG